MQSKTNEVFEIDGTIYHYLINKAASCLHRECSSFEISEGVICKTKQKRRILCKNAVSEPWCLIVYSCVLRERKFWMFILLSYLGVEKENALRYNDPGHSFYAYSFSVLGLKMHYETKCYANLVMNAANAVFIKTNWRCPKHEEMVIPPRCDGNGAVLSADGLCGRRS